MFVCLGLEGGGNLFSYDVFSGERLKCAINIQPTIQTVFVLFKEKSYDDGASHNLILNIVIFLHDILDGSLLVYLFV